MEALKDMVIVDLYRCETSMYVAESVRNFFLKKSVHFGEKWLYVRRQPRELAQSAQKSF